MPEITPEEWEALGKQANSRFPGQPTPEVPQDLPAGVHPITNPVMAAGAPPVGLAQGQEQQLAQQLAPPAPPPVAPAQDLDPATLPPAGPQTVSTKDTHTTYTPGVKLDPELLEGNQAAQADAKEATAKSAEIEAKAQAKIAEAEAERVRRLENERIVAENAAERRRLELAAAQQKIADAQSEVDKLQGPPEESIGTTVKNAIAIALSTFGSALAGTRNGALDVIEADRARKLQSWKAAYERAKGKVSDQRNMYAMLRERGLDDKQAEEATIRGLNAQYDAVVKQIAAGSRAPITIEQAKIANGKLSQEMTESEARLQALVQPRTQTTTDSKTVTKEGGAGDVKTQGDVLKFKSDDIDEYKSKSRFLGRFNNLREAGADGAALAAFIAGKDGLNQGSYGESFAKMLKKYSWLGGSLEQVREKLQGGVDPTFLKEIGNALAADTMRAKQVAEPAVRQMQRIYQANGLDPRMVLGGKPSADAAAEVGATPVR